MAVAVVCGSVGDCGDSGRGGWLCSQTIAQTHTNMHVGVVWYSCRICASAGNVYSHSWPGPEAERCACGGAKAVPG